MHALESSQLMGKWRQWPSLHTSRVLEERVSHLKREEKREEEGRGKREGEEGRGKGEGGRGKGEGGRGKGEGGRGKRQRKFTMSLDRRS